MEMMIRIRAAQIRQKLRSRHNSPGFIDVLNNLTDAELVAKADEHHRECIEFELRKKAKKPDQRLSSLFEQALKRGHGKVANANDDGVIACDFAETTETHLALLYRAALKSVEAHPVRKPEVFTLEIDDEEIGLDVAEERVA